MLCRVHCMSWWIESNLIQGKHSKNGYMANANHAHRVFWEGTQPNRDQCISLSEGHKPRSMESRCRCSSHTLFQPLSSYSFPSLSRFPGRGSYYSESLGCHDLGKR